MCRVCLSCVPCGWTMFDLRAYIGFVCCHFVLPNTFLALFLKTFICHVCVYMTSFTSRSTKLLTLFVLSLISVRQKCRHWHMTEPWLTRNLARDIVFNKTLQWSRRKVFNLCGDFFIKSHVFKFLNKFKVINLIEPITEVHSKYIILPTII